MRGGTFFVGKVGVGVFERREVAIANEEAIGKAVEDDEEGEGFAEGEDEGAEGDAEDGGEGDQTVGEGEYFEVAEEHSDVGHDDGDGVDDGQLTNGQVSLAWVAGKVPW